MTVRAARLTHISQAGKFGLIPTAITLGTGAAWLGVVSGFSKWDPGPPQAQPHPRGEVGKWRGQVAARPQVHPALTDHIPL